MGTAGATVGELRPYAAEAVATVSQMADEYMHYSGVELAKVYGETRRLIFLTPEHKQLHTLVPHELALQVELDRLSHALGFKLRELACNHNSTATVPSMQLGWVPRHEVCAAHVATAACKIEPCRGKSLPTRGTNAK